MQKGVVCIVTEQEASAFRSTQPIARLLCENGYQIEYVGLFDEDTAEYLRKQGFVSRSFIHEDAEEVFEVYENASFRKSISGYRSAYKRMVEWEEKTIRECYDHYRKHPPVLVLYEIITTSWVIPFVLLNVPLIGFSITLAAPFNFSIPSVHSHLVPSQAYDIRDRIRIARAWVQGYLVEKYKEVRHRIRLRVTFGLSRIPSATSPRIFKRAGYRVLWGDYGIRLDIPTLYFCPKEFDFPFARIRNRHYAGTSVALDRVEKPFDWGAIEGSGKIIYSTLGSLSAYYDEKDRKRFYSAIIEAIGGMAGYRLVLQVGNRNDLDGIVLPGNVHVCDWAPHTELFARVSLIICHAGLATLREAICFGIPVIVFPWGADQCGNASRVVYHNVGLRGDFYTVTPGMIVEFIGQITGNAGIAESVKRLQRQFLAQLEFPFGIKFFEQCMRSTRQ